MDKELVHYISRSRGAGATDSELRSLLLGVGWTEEVVEQALFEAGSHLPIIHFSEPVGDQVFNWHKGYQLFFRLLALLILIIIVGVIGVFGYQVYSKNSSPEMMTFKMLKAVAATTGLNYDGAVSVVSLVKPDLSGDSTSSVKLPTVNIFEKSTTTVNFSGAIESNLGARPTILLNTNWKNNKDHGDGFNGEAEFRLIEDVLYVYLSKVGKFNFFNLESMTGQWISITPADMAWLGIDFAIVSPSTNEVMELRQRLLSTKIIALTQFNGHETVGNLELDKYQFSVDLPRLREALGQYIDLSKYVDLNLPDNVVFGTVWLDDKYLPNKANLQINGRDTAIDFVLNFNNYNSQTKINAPTNATSLINLSNLLATSTDAFKSR